MGAWSLSHWATSGRSPWAFSVKAVWHWPRPQIVLGSNLGFARIRDILGKSFGVYGYPEETLRDIGMYHMMKESAVEKAKNRALKKLARAYPDSKLKVWQSVYSIMRRPILPPEDDAELRKGFPQHIRVLAEVYAILSEADGRE